MRYNIRNLKGVLLARKHPWFHDGFSVLVVVLFSALVGGLTGMWYEYNHLPKSAKVASDTSAVQSNQKVSDLVIIRREFDWLAADSLRDKPDVFCKKLAGDFGEILDENEIDRNIDYFSPADSVPEWHRSLYKASARYLREHCGKYAAEWKYGDPEWKYYERAVKFVVMSR